MKSLLVVIIIILVYQSPDARQFISDKLIETAEFIQPNDNNDWAIPQQKRSGSVGW